MKATREAPLLHQTGANLLLADYRGYGSSSPVQATGPRTEEDARAAMRYLVEQRHLSPSDIYIAGWSIGSGVATQLAVESPHSAGLILLSPISSVYDVANEDLIYRTMLRPSQWIDNANNFANKNKIASVHIPVLIVSGTADTIALPWMPRLLYDRANQSKTLHMLDGVEHNDLWDKGDGALVGYIRNFVSDDSSSTAAQ